MPSIDFLGEYDGNTGGRVLGRSTGNPDGNVLETTFDKAIKKQARILAPKVRNHIVNVLGMNTLTVPFSFAIDEFITAFAGVGYQNKRLYKREDFLNFWRPKMIEFMTQDSIDQWFNERLYPNLFDRIVRSLREMRAMGKVPDMIWNPSKLAPQFDHQTPFDAGFEDIKKFGKKIMLWGAVGVGVYLFAPMILKSSAKAIASRRKT